MISLRLPSPDNTIQQQSVIFALCRHVSGFVVFGIRSGSHWQAFADSCQCFAHTGWGKVP